MPIWETIENLAAYLPRDRIIALGKGEDLPEFAHGSTLFADISGFTPLTEAVVSRYGPRRGGEELTNHLNTVYDALIREVDGYDGSVIGFAGDAITTWFRDDDGTKALACAFRMQSTMTAFQSITLPDGAVYSLGMKVAVAAGRVRRFVVGDIEIQRSDLIAGDVLERLADAEHAAERGDVVCDGFTAEALTSAIIISERRPSETGIPVAVVERMPHPPEPLAVNDIPLEGLTAEKLRPWLIREIFERVVSGQGEFLTELRPAAAVFIRFVGIAFETDPDAPVKLNTYTCWLQRVIADLGGTLVQITIGDKGSFAYAAFGAPSANEDDTARALAAAIQVRDSPPQIREIAGDVQVGVTRGTMRTGAYGGLTRRTYGILGDDVNLSARLMQNAKPGQVLISEAAARRNQDRFDLLELPRITVKGKTEPIRIFELCSRVERQTVSFKADRYRIPMIGRRSELSQIRERFEQAKSGRGQLVSIVADAGVGKSRLIAEATRIADRSGFTGFSGECQSLARNTSFSAWWPVWREFFAVGSNLRADEIPDHLAQHLRAIEPEWAQRAPLLGPVLNLDLPDTQLTAGFDAKLRRSSLISLLVACVRERARSGPLVFVLEDAHWIDAASREILIALTQAIARMPIVVMVAHRPEATETLLTTEETTLDYHTRIELGDFSEVEARELIASRLEKSSEHFKPTSGLIGLIVRKSGGNPFFIEELINYLEDDATDGASAGDPDELELPNSMHSLVLSRIDQLSHSEQISLKVSSVIGRLFYASMLLGVYPTQVDDATIRGYLENIRARDFIEPEAGTAELAYFFKHVVIQEVAYESLPHAFKSQIHEAAGHFLEKLATRRRSNLLDLLAFHFGRSDNTEKQRQYFHLAADAARRSYSNEAAIDYFERLLPLSAPDEKHGLLIDLGGVLETTGDWARARECFDRSLELARAAADARGVAHSESSIGELLRKHGDYGEATEWLTRSERGLEAAGDLVNLGQNLHSQGTLAAQTGNLDEATRLYQKSLKIRQEIGDRRKAADLLNNLGILDRMRGDWDACEALYNQALEIRRELNDRWALANSFNNMGMLFRSRGDFAKAADLIRKSLKLNRAVGDRWATANSLNSLAEVALDSGDDLTAAEALCQSLRINRELGDKRSLAFVLEAFAQLSARQDQAGEAVFYAAAADQLRKEIQAPMSKADTDKMAENLGPVYSSLDHETLESADREGRSLALGSVLDRAMDAHGV